MAHVDLVEVELEESVLRVPLLQLEREQRFLDLTGKAPVRREEEHLGELLGDCAAALHDPTVAKVRVGGPGDAADVDAEVRVEAGVFHRDDRVTQAGRDLLERHEYALLRLELGEELVVVGVDAAPDAGGVLLQRLHRRQVGRPEHVRGNGDAGDGEDAEGEDDDQEPPEDPPRRDDPPAPAAAAGGGARAGPSGAPAAKACGHDGADLPCSLGTGPLYPRGWTGLRCLRGSGPCATTRPPWPPRCPPTSNSRASDSASPRSSM